MSINYIGMFDKVASALDRVYFPEKRLRAIYLAAKAHPSIADLRTPASDHYRKRIDQLHRALDSTSKKYLARPKHELLETPSITERQFRRLAEKQYNKGIAQNNHIPARERWHFNVEPPRFSDVKSPMRSKYEYGATLSSDQFRMGIKTPKTTNKPSSVSRNKSLYDKLKAKAEDTI
jgi:transposase InsO family protein